MFYLAILSIVLIFISVFMFAVAAGYHLRGESHKGFRCTVAALILMALGSLLGIFSFKV